MFKQKRHRLLLVLPEGYKGSIKSPLPMPIKNIDEILIQDSGSFMANLEKFFDKDEDGGITVMHLDISSTDKSDKGKYPIEFNDYNELYQHFTNIRAEVNHRARFGYNFCSVTIRTTYPPNCETIFYRKLSDGKFVKCSQQDTMKSEDDM